MPVKIARNIAEEPYNYTLVTIVLQCSLFTIFSHFFLQNDEGNTF